MMLDDDILMIPAKVRLLNLATQIVIRHRKIEIQRVVHIVHTRFWLAFAVEFATKQAICEYMCSHIL